VCVCVCVCVEHLKVSATIHPRTHARTHARTHPQMHHPLTHPPILQERKRTRTRSHKPQAHTRARTHTHTHPHPHPHPQPHTHTPTPRTYYAVDAVGVFECPQKRVLAVHEALHYQCYLNGCVCVCTQLTGCTRSPALPVLPERV
jgi:hypothetical protein